MRHLLPPGTELADRRGGPPVMLQVRRLAGASVSAEAGPQWRTVTLEFDGPDEPFTERLQILAGQVREPLAIDHLVLTEDGRVIFDDSFETAPGR